MARVEVPLSAFQGVGFQLADAEVEPTGLEMLPKYTLLSIVSASTDALALRLAAIEAAKAVFRVYHQLHGAIGFGDANNSARSPPSSVRSARTRARFSSTISARS
jgi:alkylation response protein AidB-like acyl-CoA dehydrogenase